MRIAIVNDQALAVEMMRRTLLLAPEHSIAWIARNGAEAVQHCAGDTPDLVLMDLFMPVMDGVEATRQIMRQSPCAILVVTADVSESVSQVFDAMGAGALDAVSMPILNEGDGAQSPLLTKIRIINRLVRPGAPATASVPAPSQDPTALVAIGASTGGPAVLATLLATLPADYPAAVAVVQHVDSQFASELARWLGQSCRLPVRVARHGDRLAAGQVVVAATNDHMVITVRQQIEYQTDPADYPYRPSVNVFFESLRRYWPRPGLAILLTGMGDDGAKGLLKLRDGGWRTIAQERESCAVYGMPKAASALGAAGQMLTPTRIGEAMLGFVTPSAGPSAKP